MSNPSPKNTLIFWNFRVFKNFGQKIASQNQRKDGEGGRVHWKINNFFLPKITIALKESIKTKSLFIFIDRKLYFSITSIFTSTRACIARLLVAHLLKTRRVVLGVGKVIDWPLLARSPYLPLIARYSVLKRSGL